MRKITRIFCFTKKNNLNDLVESWDGPYYRWLMKQVNRDDRVGDHARDACHDSHYPRSPYFYESYSQAAFYREIYLHLYDCKACSGSIKCFEISYLEYVKKHHLIRAFREDLLDFIACNTDQEGLQEDNEDGFFEYIQTGGQRAIEKFEKSLFEYASRIIFSKGFVGVYERSNDITTYIIFEGLKTVKGADEWLKEAREEQERENEGQEREDDNYLVNRHPDIPGALPKYFKF